MLAVISFPLVFEVVRIFRASRPHAEYRSAISDPFFVVFCSFLRDSPSDKSAYKSTSGAAGTCADECRRDRTSDHKSKSRKQHVRANSRDTADNRSEETTDRSAGTGFL